MKTQYVRYTLNPSNLPPLTKAQHAELAALAAMPDSEIDFSDIPELPESFWQNAVRGQFYKPVKQATTVRVDADVLAWLKREGKGYQTRINAVLREAMLRDLKASHKA
jgi:uncharacterized protein (DUF4415 family)